MKSFFTKSLLLVALIFGVDVPAVALEMPELSADEPLEFDNDEQSLTARGNAELIAPQFYLKADSVKLYRERMEAQASGDVAVSRPHTRIVSDYIKYDFGQRTFDVTRFRAGSPPFLMEAQSAGGSIYDACIEKPTVYFGEPDCLTPNICAKSVRVVHDPECDNPMDTELIIKHAVLRIGNFPIFYLPYYKYNMDEFPLYFDSEVGGATRYGFFSRNTIMYEATENFRAGMLLDYYTKRGLLVGPAYDYQSFCGKSRNHGYLRSGYINDSGILGFDRQGKPIPGDRYFAEFKIKQHVNSRLKVTGQLRYWGDSEVLRDFRPRIFDKNTDPDNFGEILYSGNSYYLSAFTRFRPNNFQRVDERLPEINFEKIPTPLLGSCVYHQMHSSLVRLERRDPYEILDKEVSNRFDAYYGITYPLYPCNALTFTPVAGGRLTHYFDRNEGQGDFTALKGQFGFDLQARAYGIWNCCSPKWGVDGLRHLVRPIVQYRYVPSSTRGGGVVPQLEPSLMTTNLLPLDIAYSRDRDNHDERNTVRLGLENFLQTRDCCYGSRDLASLSFYQDYNFERNERDPCRWSDFYTELKIKPAYWFDFSLFSRAQLDTGQLDELRTRFRLQNGRHWTLYFTTDYIDRNIHQYYLDLIYALTPHTSLYGHARYDHRLSKITEQRYGFITRLGQSWRIDYGLTYRTGAIRENRWESSIVATLIPFNTKLLPIIF